MPEAASAAAQPLFPSQTAPEKPSRKKKLTPEESNQIVELFRQGVSIKEIGHHLNIHGMVVNGLIQSARLRGLLPFPPGAKFTEAQKRHVAPLPEPTPPGAIPLQVEPETVSTEQVNPPMNNGNIQQPAPVSPSPVQDDFISGGRPVVGASGGFTGSTQAVKYSVERISPPDGLLGTHYGSFTVEELGQNYGEGQYKVTKHDPATPKFAFEYFQKIGPSYGPSRSPSQTGSHRTMGQRPFFQRQWAPSSPDEEHERPTFRAPVRPEGDRTLYDFARHSQQANTSAMDKAIEVLGTVQRHTLEQLENARKSGPDTMVTGILREQQEIAHRRSEEDRKHEEERRRDEESRWQRRQDDEQRRFEREQLAERDRHQRELERISRETEAREKQMRLDLEERERRAAEERKFLLDLEEKKLQLLRQETEANQKRLEAELQRSRDELRDVSDKTNRTLSENQEATAKHIEESQRQIQEQLDREREQLEREYKLREKHQERQNDLESKMLDMQKDHIQNSGGDQIFNTINTVIKEVSKGLEKVVDLKKLEAMTPEAQAAGVARGTIQVPSVGEGQLGQAERRQQQQQAPSQPGSEEVASAEPQEERAEGATAPVESSTPSGKNSPPIVESRMEGIIREQLKTPLFQDVIQEWATHVNEGVPPSAFANMYLEMMRDERNGEGRKACAAFATFMQPRNWTKMYAVLKDGVSEEVRRIFELPQAAQFYEGFRAMVIEQINDYWEQFIASRQNKNGAAAAPPPVPASSAPVEPKDAIPAKRQASSGQTP